MNRRILLTATGLLAGLAGCRWFPTQREKEAGTAPGYELLPVIKNDPFYQWQPEGLTQTFEDYAPPGIIDNKGCSFMRRWGHPGGNYQPHFDAGRAAALNTGYHETPQHQYVKTVNTGKNGYARFRINIWYASRDDTVVTSWYGSFVPDPTESPDPNQPPSPTTTPS